MTIAGVMAADKAKQGALVEATLRVVRRIMGDLFDEKNPNLSWARIEPLLVGLIQQRNGIAAALSADLVRSLRLELAVAGRYVPTVAPLPSADDIVPWIRAAGPATAIDLLNTGAADVLGLTVDSVEGSVARLVLDGGRNTIATNVDRDPKCLGYRRAASASCCSFCAMLTGRLYNSAETAGEGADWHPNCHCTAVPVYRSDQTAPANTDHYRAIWNESTRGLSGNDARIAFRRAIEGRSAPVA